MPDGIQVDITAENSNVSANVTGSITTRLTDIYSTLGLSESKVLQSIRRIARDDGYHKFFFAHMTKTLTPIPNSARVVRIDREPIVKTTRTYRNNSSNLVSYDGRLSHTDTNSVAVSWSSTKQTDTAFEIGYKVGVSGSAKVAFSNTCGLSKEHTQQVVITSDDGVRINLGPGQAALASLSVNRRVATIIVKYKVEYNGNIAGTYKDHSNTTFKLHKVLDDCNLSKSHVIEEKIVVQYYTDAEVVVTDLH